MWNWLSKRRRAQLFVDSHVQGALLGRVVLYWFACLLSVALMMVCWTIWSERPQSSAQLFARTWAQCGPALLASLLLLPMVLMDCMRLSNKFVGPIFRLRREMKQLADGQPVRPVKFRDGDFWFDFAEDFNRMAAQVESSRGPAEQVEQVEQVGQVGQVEQVEPVGPGEEEPGQEKPCGQQPCGQRVPL